MCPNNSDSWCFYKRALAQGETPHIHSVKPPYLSNIPSDKQEDTKKICTDLTRTKLLKRSLKGRIQNLNKSLHAKLWAIMQQNEVCWDQKSQVRCHFDRIKSQLQLLECNSGSSLSVWCLSKHSRWVRHSRKLKNNSTEEEQKDTPFKGRKWKLPARWLLIRRVAPSEILYCHKGRDQVLISL